MSVSREDGVAEDQTEWAIGMWFAGVAVIVILVWEGFKGDGRILSLTPVRQLHLTWFQSMRLRSQPFRDHQGGLMQHLAHDTGCRIGSECPRIWRHFFRRVENGGITTQRVQISGLGLPGDSCRVEDMRLNGSYSNLLRIRLSFHNIIHLLRLLVDADLDEPSAVRGSCRSHAVGLNLRCLLDSCEALGHTCRSVCDGKKPRS